ncbi:MAG: hypothetical protein N5P05_000824 [Chroococcopsis gigantea SAG 12.99]|jgi:predicted HD superfamily hydrolase involved in NAD metabolism|nr:bis(5'-nucleosyl)-tetraphosphatase (symmetrical) YqeK [Chlorogloea purpurea SAG 13.99]MDV2999218.1 hypothetical protein [Chroococcopsis gigantea SAG 12.99]
MFRDEVLAWLQDNVPPRRLTHILSVEKMCADLATRHGLEPSRAARAGLLHDAAKFFPPPLLLTMAESHGVEIDDVCRSHPHLLHAEVSAIVARDQFGVKDEEILWAIRNHTLGRPGMSDLSCIVFIADALEPGRGDTGELENLRLLSKENLYKTVLQTCEYSLKYLLNTHCPIHPRTILTRNWALQIVKNSHQERN